MFVRSLAGNGKSRLCRRIETTRSISVKLTDEIKQAVFEGKPVVALESTIISHGMPYPRNLGVAKEVEQAVRLGGAIPATIAVIDGVPKVGLSEEDLLRLSKNTGTIVKASTRDLGFVCANKLSAATTVASTMKLAHLAGISVFATGGIGGVHRGAESSMDISADLIELSRTPVTVVCAGIKSILDIQRSLEVLETHGVPVVGFNAPQFPGFFTNDSGVRSPMVATDPAVIARMMAHNRLLELRSGIVVGVPNPSPAHAEKIQYAVTSALLSASEEGISGAAITPYLLSRIEHLTGGESLDSNVALVLNNARIAAQVAAEYAALRTEAHNKDKQYSVYFGGSGQQKSETPASPSVATSSPAAAVSDSVTAQTQEKSVEPQVQSKTESSRAETATSSVSSSSNSNGSGDIDGSWSNTTRTESGARSQHDVVVVGGAVVDLIGTVSAAIVRNGSSNPGTVRTTYGGVGRNIAEAVARLGGDVALASAVADDPSGRDILARARQVGIDVGSVRVLPSAVNQAAGLGADSPTFSTAVYNAIHDSAGELCVGIADMSVFAQIDAQHISTLEQSVRHSRIVVSDGNISADAFRALSALCHQHGAALFFEPTSDAKCLLPFEAGCADRVDIMKPNASELVRMAQHCLAQGLVRSGKATVANTLAGIVASRADRSHSSADISVTDIRILANAIQAVMSEAPQQQSKATRSKVVHGKHVVVSLGARGVLWCGPARLIAGANSSSSSSGGGGQGKNSSVVVDEQSGRGSVHLPAMPVADGALMHTNGAGDALCGGLISEIVTRTKLHEFRAAAGKNAGAGDSSNKGSSQQSLLLPDLDCLQSGLQNAHRWIVSRK